VGVLLPRSDMPDVWLEVGTAKAHFSELELLKPKWVFSFLPESREWRKHVAKPIPYSKEGVSLDLHLTPVGVDPRLPWSVTEGICGFRLGRFFKKREDAIDSAVGALALRSLEEILNAIAANVKEYGLSPRYGIKEPIRMIRI